MCVRALLIHTSLECKALAHVTVDVFWRTPPCYVQVFEPLVEKCKRLNRAMRIGTNHGSLSARILSYYGDTPRGMVESAFEFANICRNLDYHNFLFSMKASNPLVMVQAYRLLAEEMYSNGWDYPLHLGVTEVCISSMSAPCLRHPTTLQDVLDGV